MSALYAATASCRGEEKKDHLLFRRTPPHLCLVLPLWTVYLIGDRVKVLWKDALYGATVIKVHPIGKVDVVYDVDGTVGAFLTAAAHGLKKVAPAKKKGKRGGRGRAAASASSASASSPLPAGVVEETVAHRADRDGLVEYNARTCQFDGCTTRARRGFQHCTKHGGGNKKTCSVSGCSDTARSRGLCGTHSTHRKCWIAECTSKSVSKLKLCTKHGGFGFCAHPSGCDSPASKARGNCYRHTARK